MNGCPLYDDKTFVINTQKIHKVRLLSKRVYSPHNEPFLVFKFYKFLQHIAKGESFTKGPSKNRLWPSPTVCVDVDVKV